MRHRVAGNRVNMARPRRVSAFRNMIDGLFVHEHMTTTLARCKAVQGEAETLIATAIRGHNAARKHLAAVVPDEFIAEQVLSLARRGAFRMDHKIPPLEELNAQRAERKEYPLSEQGRRMREERLTKFQKEMRDIIADPEEAQQALTAAREAMAIELHARRTILKHLPRELTVKKIFEQYVARYNGRHGGYTRISKIGFRQGDASEMARLEMVQ